MTIRSTALLLAVAAAGFGAAGYFYAQSQAPQGDTAVTATAGLTEAEVRNLIGEHLVANPEIIRDALEELQRKEQEAELAARTETIASEPRLFESERHVVLGNPDGDVTLVEFFDYNCGYCKRAHADMERLIADDPNLRVVLKEFPLLGEPSLEAAQVGAAVHLVAPDRYSEFHGALITERGAVNGERALAIAGDLGLDVEAIRTNSQSDQATAIIAESYELARKLAITGTPSYVTTQEVVVGAIGFDGLKAKIAEARAACGTPPC